MLEQIVNGTNKLTQWWPWYLRSCLLWLLLLQISPETHRVFPESSQTVHTQAPYFCVHTTLIDEVDEWKIQRSLQLVREMGATTIVEFFPWSYIEPERGVFRWHQADRIVRHAELQGVRIIARLGLVPQWARPEKTTSTFLLDSAFEDFANYAAAFAARYAGKIDHYIIWNEPNLAFEWGFSPPAPERYVDLLKTVYQPIKHANPNAVILSGALAPTLEPDGSPNGMNDLIFLKRMLEAGAAQYMDALAVHTYGFTHSATDSPSPETLNFRRAELLQVLMADFGLGNMPIFITESGWNDSPRWALAVTPSQRVAQTVNSLLLIVNEWQWAETLCLWILRYPRPQGNYRDDFTLITPEFQLKPIYHAVKAFAQGNEQTAALWLPAPEEPR